ncbi:MAG: methyltransferase domain-containing protein [bacterium]|nr:methyltransferase domain-containing protein [bacterium]
MSSLLANTFFYPYQVFFKAEKAENEQMMAKHASGIIGDLGCGSANYKPYCLSLEKVQDYIGMDYPVWGENFNQSMNLADLGGIAKSLLRASALGAEVYVDGTQLAIGNNKFDTILSLGVLEHVFKYEAYLREVHRVLKPGGKLLITTPFLYQAHGGVDGEDDYFRWTRSGLTKELELAGFEIVERDTFGGVGTMLSQLINGYLIRLLNIYKEENKAWKLIRLGTASLFAAPIFFGVNAVSWVLDRMSRDVTFASGYRFVAQKPG